MRVCVSSGEGSLVTVHSFLIDNFDWLTSQLSITPLLASVNDNSCVTRPVLSQQQPLQDTDRSIEHFNPLETFASLGHSQFNHVRAADFVAEFLYGVQRYGLLLQL